MAEMMPAGSKVRRTFAHRNTGDNACKTLPYCMNSSSFVIVSDLNHNINGMHKQIDWKRRMGLHDRLFSHFARTAWRSSILGP
jgi:hypothetical protein